MDWTCKHFPMGGKNYICSRSQCLNIRYMWLYTQGHLYFPTTILMISYTSGDWLTTSLSCCSCSWVLWCSLTSQVISVTFYVVCEKSDKFCWGSNFGLRFFYVSQIYNTGPKALLPFWKKLYSGFLRFEKIHRPRLGLNPLTSDSVAT